MTAILKVDTIQDTAGNNIINESSNTITIGASGDTTNIVGTLQNNGSALSFATVNGITEADQWRLSADKTNVSSAEVLDSNWERNDTGFDKIGTGMSESSGVFTFPSTGIYYVSFHIMATGAGSNYISSKISITANNSSYAERAEAYANTSSSSDWSNASSNLFLDVTDTSNVKVRFKIDSDNSITYKGSTNSNYTWANFIRLGDT